MFYIQIYQSCREFIFILKDFLFLLQYQLPKFIKFVSVLHLGDLILLTQHLTSKEFDLRDFFFLLQHLPSQIFNFGVILLHSPSKYNYLF